jgi:hypothetical protein
MIFLAIYFIYFTLFLKDPHVFSEVSLVVHGHQKKRHYVVVFNACTGVLE